MQSAIAYPIARPSTNWPWLMIIGRAGLFAGFQALFALGFFLAGSGSAWDASAAWWPVTVTLANITGLLVMTALFRQEGRSYWDLFRIRRETIRGDLLALAGALVVAGPAGYLPNVLLAGWLFSDAQTALNLLVRPLPLWAAYASLIVFSITQGLIELPTYFGYAMPRLEAQGVSRWLAVVLPALMLGLQHLAAPLVFDLRFIAWRGLMFLPFALVVGVLLHWRPRLLPYMAVVHVLMDASFALMFLEAAY